MALTDPSRCSVAFRDRGDPLAGSAPVASRWLLIEHPGPWSKEPLDTPPLTGSVGERVARTCAPFGGRVLLIRRPGRRGSEEGVRAWFAVDTVRGTWLHGLWRTPDDLVLDVWSKMKSRGLKNVLIVDADGRPIGVLNARDALGVLLQGSRNEESLLRDYVMGVGYH